MTEKERIEKAAIKHEQDVNILKLNRPSYMGYIAGATVENERMAELLKQERNKAIDEIKHMIESESDDDWSRYDLLIELEALKS